MTWIAAGIVGVLALWISWTVFVNWRIEMPRYRVVESRGEYEIREYDPYIVAETRVSGMAEQEALYEGFRRLAGYIFGGNTAKTSIAMTAPVGSQKGGVSEKIAMTAPVGREKSDDEYVITFMMPSSYTLETLPQPEDARVTFRQVEARKVAVMRFAGYGTERRMALKTKTLQAALARDSIATVGDPILGFYNDPYSFPLMMRNEVMMELRQ